jgi:hypothetical protein
VLLDHPTQSAPASHGVGARSSLTIIATTTADTSDTVARSLRARDHDETVARRKIRRTVRARHAFPVRAGSFSLLSCAAISA